MENLDKEIQQAQARVKKINDLRKRKIVHLGVRRKYWERIPWGIFTLDTAIGCDPNGNYGIPVGARIEIIGDASTCKSTLALDAVRAFQRAGKKRAAWIDAEDWLEERLVVEHGVDPRLLETAVPQTLEEAADTLIDWILSGEYDIIVWDSIGALATGEEVEKSSEERATSPIARVMTRLIKNYDSAISSLEEQGKTLPTVIFINQYSMKIGGYGDPRNPKGGYHWGYFMQLSIALTRKPEGIMYTFPEIGMEEEVGRQLAFKIRKNHTAPDETIQTSDSKAKDKYESMFALFLKAVPEWGYKEAGMADNQRQVALLAVKFGIINRTGAWYVLPSGEKFQGSEKLMEYLKAEGNASVFENVKSEVARFLTATVSERSQILKERKSERAKTV